MSDDTSTIELLREACAASRAAAPGEAGAWSRFEAGRRRSAVTTRIAVGFAFAAILAAAITLAGVAGRLGTGAVAPAGDGLVAPTTALEPSASTPGQAEDEALKPVGVVLEVGSGSVAGHPWSYELFRNARGEVCTRWGGDLAPGSCDTGSDPMTGVNPVAAYDGTAAGRTPYATDIEGLMPAAAVRVDLAFRGRAPLRLTTTGGAEFGRAAFAVELPGTVTVTRITAYDAGGRVVHDDTHPYNTPPP